MYLAFTSERPPSYLPYECETNLPPPYSQSSRDHSKWDQTSNRYSYLHHASHTSQASNAYLFDMEGMDDTSLLPVFTLDQRKVMFTLGLKKEYAVYFNKSLHSSLTGLLNKIKLPTKLDQDRLNKIAIIANYLCRGKEFEYIDNSARTEQEKLKFSVKKENFLYQVTVPSLKHECEVSYHLKEALE